MLVLQDYEIVASHTTAEDRRWIARFRTSAMLDLDEQIKCCEVVTMIWDRVGNLDAAEASARIEVNLKIVKYGYHSYPVVQAILKLASINRYQGDSSLSERRASQARRIANTLKPSEQVCSTIQHSATKLQHDKVASETKSQTFFQTQLVDDFFTNVSPTDYMHQSSWDELTDSADLALDRLFAA